MPDGNPAERYWYNGEEIGNKGTKRNKFSRIFRIIVYAFLVFFCNTSAIRADMGPKPSIQLTILNGPDAYYVALLADFRKLSGTNTELKLESVTEKSVNDYMNDFLYDGWHLFENPVGKNIMKSNNDGRYYFSYMVPDHFKVIIISTDGTVFLSEEHTREEFNAECTYDVETGNVTEKVISKKLHRVTRLGIFLILTFLIELLVLKAFKFPLSRRNLLTLLITNIFTNVPYNLVLLSRYSPLTFYEFSFSMEIIIILAEAIIYAIFLEDKEKKRKPKKSILYGIAANVASAASGIALYSVLTL